MPENLNNRLKRLFNESMHGISGFQPGIKDVPGIERLRDKKRKRIERQGEQRKNRLKEKESLAKKTDTPIDPRTYLEGSMKYTLLEQFLAHLVEYLESGRSKPMLEVFSLMEEYPKLKEFVKNKSQEALPKNAFSVYAAREALHEDVGHPARRSGTNPHNWYLTKQHARDAAVNVSEAIIMEAKVSPDHALLYIPAFSGLLEKFILGGKIDEPQTNVVRKAKGCQEIVLPHHINSGLVIERG